MRLKAPVKDKLLGLRVYGTQTSPVPGRIKEKLGDFIVEERLKTGFLNRLQSKPSNKNCFPILRISKEGVDSLTMISKLSSEIKVPVGCLRFLGLKDSRAKVTQYVAVLSRRFIPQGKIELLGWADRPPSKNDLLGNSFKVTVRTYISIRKLRGNLQLFLKEIEEGKVPNFYGYQRFGSPRGVNHVVGKEILHGNYKEAVLTYLTGKWKFERREEVRNWRRNLLEMDFRKAYKEIPRGLTYERKVLSSLIRTGSYEKAFKSMPISLRRLFINAYQSYLFNKTLSKRIEKGFPINSFLVGDFALSIATGDVKTFNGDVKRNYSPAAQIIGYGYREKEGVQGELEREVLREEGISHKMFYVKKMPEISCKGGFRPLQIPLLDFCLTINSENSVTLTFTLGRGGYASTLLRELIKPRDPYSSGF